MRPEIQTRLEKVVKVGALISCKSISGLASFVLPGCVCFGQVQSYGSIILYVARWDSVTATNQAHVVHGVIGIREKAREIHFGIVVEGTVRARQAIFAALVVQLEKVWRTIRGPHGVDACIEGRAFTWLDRVLSTFRVRGQWSI